MKKQLIFALIITLIPLSSASAHQSGCHRWHSCPSDTGSYVCGDLGYTSGCPKIAAPKQKSITPVKKVVTPAVKKVVPTPVVKKAKVYVKGYYKKEGTYVKGYWRN